MRAAFPPRATGRTRAPYRISDGLAPMAERLLHVIGADPVFAESVLGDLAEERALRSARDGARAARWWYAREALRSTPHLVVSAVRHASWQGRARLAVWLAGVALVATVAMTVLLDGNGAPARLVAEAGDDTGGILVNNVRPVKIVMRVLDSAGHALPDTGVRYQWSAGTRIPVSANGVATCTESGDATVLASLGNISTELVLRCRPVDAVLAGWGMELIVGGASADVPFIAVDADGRRVTQLRGQLSVENSAIASVSATTEGRHLLRAGTAGFTRLDVKIGDRATAILIHVYERARSPERIRPGQQLAVPVRLGANDMRHWRLPPSSGNYHVGMLPDGEEQHMPRFSIDGANCVQISAHSFMCAAPRGASVFVHRPRMDDQTQELSGILTVWRQESP